MASLVFAWRFSSKLCKYSSSSPLSYLTHTRDVSSVPKISNSVSSTFNWHCNSTAEYSKSLADSSLKSLKSSSPRLMLNDSSTYFLAGARHENLSNLNRRVSCEKSASNHKRYLDQLPKELYNITPEEFHRGIGILLNSMEILRIRYSLGTSFSFPFILYSIYSLGEVDVLIGLSIGSYYVGKLMEIKSIEKVVLLSNLHKQGNVPIQIAVLQLIKEVKESDRRCEAIWSIYGCVLCVMLLQILTGIYV